MALRAHAIIRELRRRLAKFAGSRRKNFPRCLTCHVIWHTSDLASASLACFPIPPLEVSHSLKRLLLLTLLISSISTVALSAQQPTPQQKEAARIATREQLRKLLETSGPKKGINISFRQSEKQPFNFTGRLKDGLTNAESLEVVIGVTTDETIGFRIYPHYKGGYINADKAKNSVALMRLLLNLSGRNFLFWGVDGSGDVFAGYTFTLESGFPEKSAEIVLYSIPLLDRFVGEMKPFIDGSPASITLDR